MPRRGFDGGTTQQTGGVRTTLYDRSMRVVATAPADSRLHFYDVEKVCYVRTC